MLGNRKLISDTMSEVYDLLKPWTDQSFWDFSQVTLEPGAIYVFGRQHLLDNLSLVKQLAETGQYIIVFGNSAEGAWTLETQLRSLHIDDLVRQGKILVIAGAEIAPEYAHITHEHFLPRILVAFVAPIFLEPSSRISTLAKTFPRINPKGIADIKYVIIKNIN